MFKPLSFFGLILGAASLSSCMTGYPLAHDPNVPVLVRVENKYIDEDSPMEHPIRFRNAGGQVVSFEYTIADQPGVPHVDRDGPNSGFVGNQYPGSEVEVPNPLKKRRVWVTLARVSYGKKANIVVKKTTTELSSISGSDTANSVEPPPLPQTP